MSDREKKLYKIIAQFAIIKNVDSLTVTLDSNSYNYTGSAITPIVTVKDDEKTLVKDVDYTASEGSTIINFTESGIKKLNTLKVGTHKLVATYTNGKTVEYSIKINDIIDWI